MRHTARDGGDRQPPVEAEIDADRLGSPEISEIDGAWRRRPERPDTAGRLAQGPSR